MAKEGEKILAFHIPSMVPQQLLSSLNEPNPSGSEAGQFFNMDFWKRTSSDLGSTLLESVKTAGQEEAKKLGRSVEFELRASNPSGDVKQDIITFCRDNDISTLFVGAGTHCRGRIPSYLASSAPGFSVVIVRDHCRRQKD